MTVDDPKGNALRAFRRENRQNSVATNLKHASVSNGQTRFIGDDSLVIVGSERIDGESVLNGTQTVNGDVVVNIGSITVPGANPIKIWQAPGGAVIEMGPGLLWGDGNDISLGGDAGSSAFVVLNAATASIRLVTSSASITLDSNGVTMGGLPAKTGTGLLPGLIWKDPTTNRLYRITS